MRSAWGNSNNAPPSSTQNPTDDQDGPSGGPGTEPILAGWARLDQILDRALAEAALGTDDEVLARLAERWCEVQPQPQHSDDGPVLVCRPDPPVLVDGHVFTLELGGEGVIGLVAAELSSDSSTSLVDAALERLQRWCTDTWTDVSPRPTEPSRPPPTQAELHSCPVEGSALLVVARFLANAEAEQWRVSVAVIDAS